VITQSVVTNGGGGSDGGTYSVTGTAAQAVAGANSFSATYGIRGGFWQSFLTPTAAMVSLTGQVVDAEGQAVRNVRITLQGQAGVSRIAVSNNFGNFRLEDIPAGETYIVSASHRTLVFIPQAIFVLEDTDLVVRALP
jgi:hypothetical protein